jgi:hypothetical protein
MCGLVCGVECVCVCREGGAHMNMAFKVHVSCLRSDCLLCCVAAGVAAADQGQLAGEPPGGSVCRQAVRQLQGPAGQGAGRY